MSTMSMSCEDALIPNKVNFSNNAFPERTFSLFFVEIHNINRLSK